MRPVRTIGQILPSPKDPLNPEEKNSLFTKFRVLTAILFTLDRLNGILNPFIPFSRAQVDHQKSRTGKICSL